jgi:hypothetical protein
MKLFPSTCTLFIIVQQAVGRSRLLAKLQTQIAQTAKLAQAIRANLRGLGYGS